MSSFLAFVSLEARLQRTSLRFVVLAGGYVLLSLLPPVLVHFSWRPDNGHLAPATHAANVFLLQPLLVSLVAALSSADALTRERDEGSLIVVALSELTDAGYVLGRWLAVVSLLLPLTLVGPGAGLLLAWSDTGQLAWQPFLLPWLLKVAPLCLGVSALFMAAGTITGGLISGSISVLGLTAAILWLGNDLLARVGRRLAGPWEWVLGESGAGVLLGVSLSDRRGVVGGVLGRLAGLVAYLRPATEGELDPVAALDYWLADALVPVGCCALALGLSVRFLRRSQPDVRPWAIPESHPLRTYWKLLNGLRLALFPDPRPGWRERLLCWGGLACLALSLAGWWQRDAWFRERGRLRFAAESDGGPEPTSPALLPGAWSVKGELDLSGRVRLSVDAELRNAGDEPLERAAFALHQDLDVSALGASGRSVESERSWDRLVVRWAPPLLPGEVLSLHVEARGRPVMVDWSLPERGGFVRSWRRFSAAKLSSDLSDLGASSRWPMVSRRLVDLPAHALTPVPRYTPWILDRRGREVVTDRLAPVARIELDLRGPRGAVLGTSCGSLAADDGGGPRLQARCSLPLTKLGIVGGPLVLLDAGGEGAGGARVACLPSHVELAELHRSAFESAEELARAAWPALGAGGGVVVVEVPPRWSPSPWFGMGWNWWEDQVRQSFEGRLLKMPERFFSAGARIDPVDLARAMMTAELAGLREPEADEQLFHRALLDAFADAEIAKAPAAVVEAPSHQLEHLAAPVTGTGQPAMDREPWWYRSTYVMRRMGPRLTDLRRRLGGSALRRGLVAFLEADPARPATSRELFDHLEAAGGRDLDDFYEDFIVGSALPQLSLEDVRFVSRGEAWRCEGRLTNLRDGRALVPLLLRTEGPPATLEVPVGPGESVPFVLDVPDRPRELLLDPNAQCLRHRPMKGIGVVEQVVFEEGT